MHIVLGLLSSIVAILYLLDRYGIDIGWINPFHWRRRRAWSKQYHGDPIYSVEDPLQIAALLIIGVAKLEGDLSAEQKQTVREQFSRNFSLSDKESAELIGSAAHLLAAPQLLGDQLRKLADRSQQRFSDEQAQSMLRMMQAVAAAEGKPSAVQREYLDGMTAAFAPQAKGNDTWG